MDDQFLIRRPDNARSLYIPQEYIAICFTERKRKYTRGKRKGQEYTSKEYNLAAAAVLRLIERWTIWKIKERPGKPRDAEYWVYMPQLQMEQYELVNAFGQRQIETGIKLLLKHKYIARRNNPNVGFDRTYQYRFNINVVQEQLDILPPFFTIKEWKNENSRMEPLELKNASLETKEAIPQVPTQVPSQNTAQEEKTALSASAEPPRPKDETPDNWGDFFVSVVDNLGVPKGMAGDVAKQLLGIAPKGERKKHNCQPPALLEDIEPFIKWYRRDHPDIDLPTSAESLALWWHRWHEHRAEQRSKSNGTADAAAIEAAIERVRQEQGKFYED